MTRSFGLSCRQSRTLAAIFFASCRKSVLCLSSTSPSLPRLSRIQEQLVKRTETFTHRKFHSHLYRTGSIQSIRLISQLRAGSFSDQTHDGQAAVMTDTIRDTTMSTVASHSSSAAKLDALRTLLTEHALDVYLVPSDDPHLSEYTPDAYKRRAFLTGFQGSAGTAVITHAEALLWTDSRYFNEASMSLDFDHWALMKQGTDKVPTITKWLAQIACDHWKKTGLPLRIGIDAFVHSASFAKELMEALEAEQPDKVIAELVTSIHSGNLVDLIWSTARPLIPSNPFRVHPLHYAGQAINEKVTYIQNQLNTRKATLAVFSALDDVAYLLNIRATGDIDTCPVGLAYATVHYTGVVTLYCDDKKVSSDEVVEHLHGISVHPYDSIVKDLALHAKEDDKNRVWIDIARTNLALVSVIPDKQLLNAQNAITPMKACKNTAELDGMRLAHVVDGAAMAEFMAWLEATLEDRPVSEVEIDEVLTACRAKQPGFLEVSFPTIAGVGSNGAIIHYRAKRDSSLLKYLDNTQPVLIDSGGQYTFGTTDVTRTWHFGTPTDEFKNYYTRVLKGNIGIDSMIFPENTPGFVLDVFARKSLWECGKDYGHGTGHGVGAALNVHEGPQSISPRWGNTEVLKKGMVVSNEPGYYEDGNFGIRIENLLEIVHLRPEPVIGEIEKDQADNQDKTFLKFEKLTMIPIQTNLIDLDLMTKEEFDWLDTYHRQVLEKVGPLLATDSPAMLWLRKSCAPVCRGESRPHKSE